MGLAELGGLGAFIAAIVAAVVAFLKLKPEAGSILIKSANDVVIIQKGLIDEFRGELADCRKRMDEYEADLVEAKRRASAVQEKLEEDIAALGWRLEMVTGERDELLAENNRLEKRVGDLENEVARLKAA